MPGSMTRFGTTFSIADAFSWRTTYYQWSGLTHTRRMLILILSYE